MRTIIQGWSSLGFLVRLGIVVMTTSTEGRPMIAVCTGAGDPRDGDEAGEYPFVRPSPGLRIASGRHAC
jgi:hypothetical protein